MGLLGPGPWTGGLEPNKQKASLIQIVEGDIAFPAKLRIQYSYTVTDSTCAMSV